MRTRWPNGFEVVVLRQQWQRPAIEEAKRLGVPRTRWAWVREVALLGDGQPRIVARSVVPMGGPAGAASALRRLGNRPLGDRLFLPGRSARDSLEIAALQPDNWLTACLSRHLPMVNQARWARRAVHRLAGQPLLVTEVFLPSLLSADSQGVSCVLHR